MRSISLRDNINKMINILKMIHQSSKGYFFSFVLYAVFESIFPYISIYFTYVIVDALIANLPAELIFTYVYWLIGLNLGVGITLKILHNFRQYFYIEMSYELENKIALKSFELDFTQIEDNNVMKLIQQAKDGTSGNGGINTYCENILGGILSSILSLVYGFVLLSNIVVSKALDSTSAFAKFLNSPYSSLIILFSLFIPSIVSRIVMKKDNKKSYNVMMGNIEGNRRASYFSRIAINYSWGKDIRIFGTKDLIIEKMNDDKLGVDHNWREYVKFNIRMMVLTFVANSLLSTIAYIFIGLKAIYGLITIGNVIAYIASITLISQGISNIVAKYSKMHLFNAYLDNYFTYLNLKNDQKFGNVETIDVNKLEIEFDNVSFKYPNQATYVLKDLSFKINNHEKLAIVGPNGAGKTTLVKLMCRLYDVTEGKILINQIPIQEFSKQALYKFYSIVFQDFKLFSYSIEDNITIGNKTDDEKLNKVTLQSGISKRIENLSQGTKTILYQRNREKGIDISGGEAQKIAIARALYKESPFVILDEPTAALDPKSEAEIYNKFNTLVQNKTTIFISHRMSSTKFCDRIIVLDEGIIKENDSHKKLLLNPDGLYSKMWNAQAKYYLN